MKTALNGVTLLECMQLIKKFFIVTCIMSVFSCSLMSGFLECDSDEVVIKKEIVVEDSGQNESQPEPAHTDMDPPSELPLNERLWTIIVYMCADNDLEASAMEDLCEMEFSDLNTQAVTVLALVDRSPSYDTSYDNWYGSRLYKLQSGREASCQSLISQEIECRDLGLVVGKETELDMSSSYVISSSLSYARKKFPANHYGLIIWGHGTGWRSNAEENSNADSLFKGFSYDGSSGTYMTLYQTGQGIKAGLNGMKLDFLGFDTCYGAELEVLYELKDQARLCAASEGLIASSGWNYQELFSDFEKSSKTPEDLCSSVMSQFKKQYAYKSGASVVCADLEKLQPYFEACNAFWACCAEKIVNRTIRDQIMGLLYSSSSCNVNRFSYGAGGSDVYLDVLSMLNGLKNYFNSPDIDEKYGAFIEAKNNCITECWASEDDCGGIGVYFSSLSDSSNLSVNHPSAYKKGMCVDQIQFVNDCDGYVPCEKDGKSFLTKLFYSQFN